MSYEDYACVPHDFFPCQAYWIFHERDNKLYEGGTSDMAYLVRQGQQEVVEEDGDDRNCIILVSIPHQHSESKKR
jgi:hypothetical protein